MKKLLLFALCLIMLSTPCHALTWQSGYSATTLTWQQAVTYCDSLSVDGATDWRLPTRLELTSLIDYSRAKPASSLNLPYDKPFWSSTEQAANETTKAWLVYFQYGTMHHADKNVIGYAKCARGETIKAVDYEDNGDGTVTDNINQLMWLQEVSPLKITYLEAAQYCFFNRTGGYGDWRIPTIQELVTTIDDAKWPDPSLYPLYGVYGIQWSSTLQVVRTYDFLPQKIDYGENQLWTVTASGCTGFCDRTNYPYQLLGYANQASYVRCVRDLPHEETPEPDKPTWASQAAPIINRIKANLDRMASAPDDTAMTNVETYVDALKRLSMDY